MIRSIAQTQVAQAPKFTAAAAKAPVAAARITASSVSSFTPASATRAQAKPAAHTALPSLALGGPMDAPMKKEADAIAKALWLGKFEKTAGGDGEVWRSYQNGSVDGDVTGRIRGVWIGGAPWSQGSTFIPKNVVDTSMQHKLGSFLGSSKSGDTTLFTFMSGTVAVDKSGKSRVTRDAIQVPADQIAKELGLGHYKQTGGGDGEVWRTYTKGTVDGDMFGRIRGVWMGGAPWSQGSTFLSNDVVNTAVGHKLGAFQSSSQAGGATKLVFANGTVTVDAKGKVTGVSA